MDVVANDSGRTLVRVGCDIGKMSDPSAIVATEEVRRERIAHFLVRHIERLPLGTSYPGVADRVAEVMAGLRAIDEQRRWDAPPREAPARRGRWGGAYMPGPGAGFGIELIVDGTGVGLPVVDLLREKGLRPTVAIFTGSERLTVHPDDAITIGKAWMVARLQTLLQAGRLHLPDTAEAAILARELQDYRIDISNSGHASFNARSGQHDDLVVALGLSVGYEVPRPPVWIVASATVKGRW